MLKKVLIEDIKRLAIGGGIPTDDHLLSNRQISLWIDYYRARLIKEYFDKRSVIDMQYIQDLGCIKLVCANKDECCEIDPKNNYKKLAIDLPQLIDLTATDGKKTSSSLFVGLLDKITNIPLLSPEYHRYKAHNKWGGNHRTCFRINNQIYFDLPKGDTLEYVNVRGLLSNPEDASKFTKCISNESCFDDTTDYPIPSFHIQIMVEMIMKLQLNMVIRTQQLDDNENNSKGTKEEGNRR